MRPTMALLVSAALVLASYAAAQYSQAPYFDQPLVQSQAYGLELALQRLGAVEVALEAGGDELGEFSEVIEGFEEDLPRFMGTLRARDAALAAELEGAVEDLEEAAESGAGLAEAIDEARELLTRAYEVVIRAEMRSDPVFTAALIVDLSLGEGGVGEGYEEATEGELAEYTMGYVALQRVHELWAEISERAAEQQRADVEEMLDFIRTLYPTPLIDARIVGNPEEAEAPVQRMIGVLETIVDAELFPGRNLAALAARLPEQLAGACQAYDAGEDERALETTIAVGYLYLNADLGDFLEFMAPETHEAAAELIGALTGLGAEDDEGEGEGDEEAAAAGQATQSEEDDEDADEARLLVADAAATCRELLEALQEASVVLGN